MLVTLQIYIINRWIYIVSSIFINFEPIRVVVFNKALPCAAGSILPSASADGYKRQEAKPLPLWA